MKKILLISIFTIFAVGLSAQKGVRKNVRDGNKAYNEQRYGAAEEKYKAAIEANASSKEASYNLANTYYRQQRWDDAVKEYQHYLTIENEDPKKMSTAWSNMGNTYLKKKANEKGQQPQQMMQPGQDPQQQQPQQKQADNLKLSMEAYKQALRLDPTDDNTRYNLAVVQKMIKDQEDENKDNNQDNKQDQKQDDKQDQKQDQKNDPKQDPKQDQKQENQMSQDNIQQILQAIEQDEKETQERVKQGKAEERKQQNMNNRRQNKDW